MRPRSFKADLLGSTARVERCTARPIKSDRMAISVERFTFRARGGFEK